MLSGKPPFHRATAAETMTAILREETPDLVTPGLTAPPLLVALDRIVRHGLEKEPDARFQTARDLGFALDGVTGSGAAVAAGPAPARRARRWAAALGVGAAAVVASLTFWTGLRQAARLTPSSAP